MENGAFRSVNFTNVLNVDDPSNRLPSWSLTNVGASVSNFICRSDESSESIHSSTSILTVR